MSDQGHHPEGNRKTWDPGERRAGSAGQSPQHKQKHSNSRVTRWLQLMNTSGHIFRLVRNKIGSTAADSPYIPGVRAHHYNIVFYFKLIFFCVIITLNCNVWTESNKIRPTSLEQLLNFNDQSDELNSITVTVTPAPLWCDWSKNSRACLRKAKQEMANLAA